MNIVPNDNRAIRLHQKIRYRSENRTNEENKEFWLFTLYKQISITVASIIPYLAHFSKNKDRYLLIFTNCRPKCRLILKVTFGWSLCQSYSLHNIFPKVTFPPWLCILKICDRIPWQGNGENTKVSNSVCGPYKPMPLWRWPQLPTRH